MFGVLLYMRLQGSPEPTHASSGGAKPWRNYPRGIRAPRRECHWDDTRKPLMPAETNSSSADALGGFLTFLDEEVFRGLGYLYALRDGNLLGALRHGGLIPGDKDLDAVLLLPLDEGLDSVRDTIAKRIADARMPFELQVNDDGKSRWLVFLQPSGDAAAPHHADIIVYPSALFARPLRGYDGSKVYSTRVQRAFSGLCYCRHFPLSSTDGARSPRRPSDRQLSRRAVCFEDAPAYLAGIYGDINKQSGVHAHGAGLLEEVYV